MSVQSTSASPCRVFSSWNRSRLAGVAILAPVGNYWWSGFPPDVFKEAWRVQFPQDQRAVWVAHHLPWLTHWWNTQKLFRGSSVKDGDPAMLSKEDRLVADKFEKRTYEASGHWRRRLLKS
jgi:hypothetical protein